MADNTAWRTIEPWPATLSSLHTLCEELTALARAYLDTIRELTAQGGNKVTIRLDAHRYAVAEALATAQRQTLPQLAAEAIDLAIARGSTR